MKVAYTNTSQWCCDQVGRSPHNNVHDFSILPCLKACELSHHFTLHYADRETTCTCMSLSNILPHVCRTLVPDIHLRPEMLCVFTTEQQGRLQPATCCLPWRLISMKTGRWIRRHNVKTDSAYWDSGAIAALSGDLPLLHYVEEGLVKYKRRSCVATHCGLHAGQSDCSKHLWSIILGKSKSWLPATWLPVPSKLLPKLR